MKTLLISLLAVFAVLLFVEVTSPQVDTVATTAAQDTFAPPQVGAVADNVFLIEGDLDWIVSFWSLCIIAQLGMLVNFFTKRIQGESITVIRDYFRDNFKSTLTAVIITQLSSVAYYMALSTGQAADILVVFGLGFMFEDTLNRWKKP